MDVFTHCETCHCPPPHTHTRTCMHAHTHTRINAHTHACMRASTLAHTHSRMHRCTHTRTHTQIHSSWSCNQFWSSIIQCVKLSNLVQGSFPCCRCHKQWKIRSKLQWFKLPVKFHNLFLLSSQLGNLTEQCPTFVPCLETERMQ